MHAIFCAVCRSPWATKKTRKHPFPTLSNRNQNHFCVYIYIYIYISPFPFYSYLNWWPRLWFKNLSWFRISVIYLQTQNKCAKYYTHLTNSSVKKSWHQNKRLKNNNHFDLGQSTNTPKIELLLNLSEVINFIILWSCEEVWRVMKLHYIRIRYQAELHQGNSSKYGFIISKH